MSYHSVHLSFRTLADTHGRGALDSTDFALGMHLIQASMSGKISTIPSSLPPGLYEQASGGKALVKPLREQFTGSSPSATIKAQPTGGSQYPSTIHPQYTGPLSASPSPATRSFSPSPNARGPAGKAQAWDVTAEDKTTSDAFFESLDPHRRGFIEGDVAVPFMLESKLPEPLLAHIWLAPTTPHSS